MFRKMLGLAALAGVLGIAAPSGAAIINLTVASGGIDRGQVCTSVTCGTINWQNDSDFAATGTVTIDDTNNLLSLSFFVDGSSIGGAAINGVTALNFDDTTYTASNLSILQTPGSLPGQIVYSITGTANATISVATLSETGGASGAYTRLAVRVSGSCTLGAGTSACGFTFGPAGTPSDTSGRYYVGPLNGFALDRYVRQTFDIGVVPEPGTLALLGVGLFGLAATGRHRR